MAQAKSFRLMFYLARPAGEGGPVVGGGGGVMGKLFETVAASKST